MSTGNKIFIGIMAVIIVALIVGFVANKTISDTEKNAINTTNTSDSMFEMYGGAIENDAEPEKNEISEEVTEDVINSNYVGVEETQPSNDITETNEQKAIRLVKEKYGTTDGVYFHIKHQDGDTYHVAVTEEDNENSTVIMWYTVNTENWHVLEN